MLLLASSLDFQYVKQSSLIQLVLYLYGVDIILLFLKLEFLNLMFVDNLN